MFNWETGRNLLGDGSIVLLRNGLNLWGDSSPSPGICTPDEPETDSGGYPVSSYLQLQV